MPVGFALRESIVHEPCSVPDSRVLEHLVGGAVSLTTHKEEPLVTMPLALALALFRAKLEVGVQRGAVRRVGGAGEAEHLVGAVVDDPDVGAVGGDVLGRRQAVGRPRAEQLAVLVVDVDLLVAVDDPDLVAGGGGRHAARIGVGRVEVVVGQRLAGRAVLERVVGGRIDHVELDGLGTHVELGDLELVVGFSRCRRR